MVYRKDLFLVHFSSIYLCDLFYSLKDLDIASYADDTTLYTVKKTKESVINALETSLQKPFKWFKNNFMKANSDKSHLLLSYKRLMVPPLKNN